MNEGLSGLFGMFDVDWQVLKFLAVVGGVATGGLASGWLLRLLGGMATKRKVPSPALFAVRGLGGAGAGLAVWLWVSGSGGGGPGQGGFLGPGTSGLPTTGPEDPNASKSSTPPRLYDPNVSKGTPAPEAPAPGKANPDTVRIELLGGSRVQDGRFYVVEGQKGALSLAELRKWLEQRRGQKGKAPLKSLELVIYQNSVAEDHAAVRDLRNWARENDLDVKTVSVDRDLP
jgi:hypothetical protein